MKKQVIIIFNVLVVLLCLYFTSLQTTGQNTWINEIHYDNSGGDVGEGIEVVLENPGSFTLSGFTVTLYNGNNGTSYASETLNNFSQVNAYSNFVVYYWNPTSIQNGAPDGLSLDYQGTVVQFLSYEGTFTATNGPANGLTSVDIGVSEPGTTPIGESLQLSGTGTAYTDFTWQSPATATFGSNNNGQTFGTATIDPEPTNHVLSFAATTVDDHTITVSWNDNDGTQPAHSFLVRANTGAISAPADGTPVSDDTDLTDGAGDINVAHGVQTYSFTNCTPNTAYNFEIYPYTNSGTDIDFKTDGTIPSATATTNPFNPPIVTIPYTRDFETGDLYTDGWSTQLVTGTLDWQLSSFSGDHFAEMSNWDGSSNIASETWLISPGVDLSTATSPVFNFMNACSFSGDTLQVFISTNYDGMSAPSSATWDTLYPTLSTGSYNDVSSGDLDISAYTGGTAYVAFKYKGTDTDGKTWQIDDINISENIVPTQLAITTVAPSAPYVGANFDITVEAQDGSGNPGNVTTDTEVQINLVSGSGTLTGTVTGTILNGDNSVVISGLSYDIAESIDVNATVNSGMTTLSASSNQNIVIQALSIVTFPYTRDFETGDLYTDGWSTQVVTGTMDWQLSSFSGDHFAEMSNWDGSTNNASETWLISPGVDLSTATNAAFNFMNACSHSGDTIQVFISTNYDGMSTPSSATWDTLYPTLSTGSYNDVSSGDLDISAYTGGTAYVAFKYTGTNTDGKTWQIDDINIFEPSSAPVISNILINPSTPSSTDNVHVFADVTDLRSIDSVKVYWGLTSGQIQDSIMMSANTLPEYQTDNPIPAQANGATVYFILKAWDNNQNLTVSNEESYTVVDGAGGTEVAITEFINNTDGDENLHEYIELYNYGSATANLKNWSVLDEDNDSTGISGSDLFLPPDSYLLLAKDKSAIEAAWFGGSPNASIVEVSYTLANGSDEIIIKDDLGNIVWSLAYADDEAAGYATFLEYTTDFATSISQWGNKATPGIDRNGNDPATGNTLLGYEGNNNTVDVLAYTATGIADLGSPLAGNYTPAGGGTTPVITNILLNPASPTSSDPVNIAADVTDDGSIDSVKLYWGTGSGQLSNVIVMDPGTAPQYATSSPIPAQAEGTTVFYQITAWDNDQNSSSTTELNYFIPYTGNIPISTIQYTTDPSGDSPLMGQTISTGGIVYAVDNSGTHMKIFIQDATGPWNGVYIFDDGDFISTAPSRGDSITLTAYVDEYFGLTELNNISAFTIESSGNPLYPPSIISTADMAEEYEGVLVQFLNAECVNSDAGFGMWTINNGALAADSLFVDDDLFSYSATQGDFYDVKGAGYYSFSEFKVLPRDGGDVTAAGSTAPVIANISINPSTPTSSDPVNVSAEITDDGTIVSALVNWGLAQGSLTNTINMSETTAPTYTTDNPIGAQPSGTTVYYQIVAEDDQGEITNSNVQSYMIPFVGITPIYNIQYTTDPGGDSPLAGSIVRTKGIVTGVKASNGYFLQDSSALWNGIWVYDQTNTPAIGDEVVIKAEVDEYFSLTELTNIDSFVVNSSGNQLPDPLVANTNEVTEPYEGVLIRINNATCINTDAGFGMWTITNTGNNADSLLVDDDLFAFTPTQGAVYDISGVGHYSYNEFKILPRSVSDIIIGLDEIQNNESIVVYPNPAQHDIHIQTNELSSYQISIFDYTGALIKEKNAEGSLIHISLDGFESGLYLIKIRNLQSMKVSTEKVIVK